MDQAVAVGLTARRL